MKEKELAIIARIVRAIEDDKRTWKSCGRDTTGHSRALMLIDEIMEDEIHTDEQG